MGVQTCYFRGPHLCFRLIRAPLCGKIKHQRRSRMPQTEHPNANCFCRTCGRWFNHRGIASHRAIHRRREEECTITYSTGKTFRHLFRGWIPDGDPARLPET